MTLGNILITNMTRPKLKDSATDYTDYHRFYFSPCIKENKKADQLCLSGFFVYIREIRG